MAVPVTGDANDSADHREELITVPPPRVSRLGGSGAPLREAQWKAFLAAAGTPLMGHAGKTPENGNA